MPANGRWDLIQRLKGKNLIRITAALHENQCTFMTSHSVLRMADVSDKSCREIPNTRFIFHNLFQKIVSFMK